MDSSQYRNDPAPGPVRFKKPRRPKSGDPNAHAKRRERSLPTAAATITLTTPSMSDLELKRQLEEACAAFTAAVPPLAAAKMASGDTVASTAHAVQQQPPPPPPPPPAVRPAECESFESLRTALSEAEKREEAVLNYIYWRDARCLTYPQLSALPAKAILYNGGADVERAWDFLPPSLQNDPHVKDCRTCNLHGPERSDVPGSQPTMRRDCPFCPMPSCPVLCETCTSDPRNYAKIQEQCTRLQEQNADAQAKITLRIV